MPLCKITTPKISSPLWAICALLAATTAPTINTMAATDTKGSTAAAASVCFLNKVCANTPSTAVDRKRVAFTIPTFIAVTRLMVRENSNIKNIYDLKDKTVVTIWGSNIEKTFDQMNAKFTLRASNLITNDFDGALSVMETNTADAFMMDDVLLKLMQAASKNKTKYVITKGDLAIQPLSLMMRKDDPGFKKLVDGALAKAMTPGEAEAIYKKWFTQPIPPKGLNLNFPLSEAMQKLYKAPNDKAFE